MTPNNDDDQKLRRSIECLPVHAHLCLLYETREEQFAAVVPFIRCGLARGDRCVYIVDENTAAEVLQILREGGVDVDAALNSEALVVITKREAYLKEGVFSPESMIALLRSTSDTAEADGFHVVSATGEMTWALGDEPGVGRLIEYESKLNYFLPTCDMLAICQYNINRFPPETIHDVIYTHPLVIVGGDIYENFYYMPPDVFLASDREAAEVNYLVSNLKSHSEDRRALQQANEDLKQTTAQLRKLNRTLRMLSDVNEVLVHAMDEKKLLRETCNIIANVGGYRMTWVGYAEQECDKIVRPVASAGYDAGYLDLVTITWSDDAFGQGPTGAAIRTGMPAFTNDIAHDAQYAPWRVAAMKRGYASAMAIPLISGDKTLGALSLYSDQTDAFDEPEVDLLTELANDLAYGIYALRTAESLRQSEERYRRVVEDQTEFIVRWRPDGRRTFVNDSYCRRFNRSREELLSSNFMPMVLEEDKEAIRKKIESLTPQNPVATDEHRGMLDDGTIVWQQWTDRAIFDDKGQVVEYQSVGRDITELKRAEKQLLMAEAHKREFHKAVILAATEGKLTICDHKDVAKIAGPTMATWKIAQADDVSLIRNAIAVLAESIGMDEERIYDLKVCIGEASTNAYKHAGGGTASLHRTPDGVLVVVSDHGPGIDAMSLPDVALAKGYSTAGTLGMGYKTIIALADKVYLATDSTGTTTGIEMALHRPEISPGESLLQKTVWP